MLNHYFTAIVGAGFSGTMTAYNLIQNLPDNSDKAIALIEKTDRFACGIAYSTTNPDHLLNVRANKMGAIANDLEHFYKWLQSNKSRWQEQFPTLNLTPETFIPRHLYFLYLTSLLDDAKKLAQKKKCHLHLINDEAISCSAKEKQILINFKTVNSITTDNLVLATNLPAQENFAVNVKNNDYIANIWNPPPNSLLTQTSFSNLPPHTRVIMIGAGLTMIDAAVSLIKNGYQGEILALSKHGFMSEHHLDNGKNYPQFIDVKNKQSLLTLFKQVREEIFKAAEKDYNWRDVIDSLRPITIPLWESLSLNDKKQFVRHLMSYWNKWRHRIPTQSYRIIEGHKEKGKFHNVSGKVKKIEQTDHGLNVTLSDNRVIHADYVLNCSGAQFDITKTAHPLLTNMLEQEFIAPHPLNMGLSMDQNYRTINKRNLPIYTLGQLAIGQKWESVAVPELREQAFSVAKTLCK